MAEDPIRKYSDAIGELNKAREQVRKLGEIVNTMLVGLRQPYEFMISDVSIGFPTEVTMSRDAIRLSGKAWPQIQQVAEVLVNLHNKRRAVEQIWHSLSDTDKGIVSPLPEKK